MQASGKQNCCYNIVGFGEPSIGPTSLKLFLKTYCGFTGASGAVAVAAVLAGTVVIVVADRVVAVVRAVVVRVVETVASLDRCISNIRGTML